MTVHTDLTSWGMGSGLDRIRAIAAALPTASHVPYTHLGLEFSKAEKGWVELAWTPTETILNRAGIVHGGYVATALDEVCGVAAISLSEPSTPYLTMSLNVDYLRPLLAGETYTLVGTVLQSGGIRTLTRAQISDGVGRLCVQATGALTPNRKLLRAVEEARSAD